MNEADPDFAISATGNLSRQARALGLLRFPDLAEYVRLLPYGRIAGQRAAHSVLAEQRGTCSSKHALLAMVSREAGRDDIDLMLGIFEMHERNTPGVGAVLQRYNLSCIPEAHCYLRADGRRLDYTGLPGGRESPFQSLLAEEPIDPTRVILIKSQKHREFVQKWSTERGLDPERVWHAREECIEALVLLSSQR
jgi:hypothetical protein